MPAPHRPVRRATCSYGKPAPLPAWPAVETVGRLSDSRHHRGARFPLFPQVEAKHRPPADSGRASSLARAWSGACSGRPTFRSRFWSRRPVTARPRSCPSGHEQDRRPFAWVTLDEDDNDPLKLLASIVSVLDTSHRAELRGAGGASGRRTNLLRRDRRPEAPVRARPRRCPRPPDERSRSSCSKRSSITCHGDRSSRSASRDEPAHARRTAAGKS